MKIIAAYDDFDMHLVTDGDAVPQSDVQVREFWMGILSDPGVDLRYFAIDAFKTPEAEAEMVGACSLQHIDMRNRHAELSIWLLGEQHYGKGYGRDAVAVLLSYAFEMVNLEKVFLGVFDFNEAAIRIYERVGFRYEGRLRHMLYYDGAWRNQWEMGLLRSEWEAFQRPAPDGLRPYHTGDYPAALALLQRQQPQADARAVLRRYWQQLDSVLMCRQVNGVLTELLLQARE